MVDQTSGYKTKQGKFFGSYELAKKNEVTEELQKFFIRDMFHRSGFYGSEIADMIYQNKQEIMRILNGS